MEKHDEILYRLKAAYTAYHNPLFNSMKKDEIAHKFFNDTINGEPGELRKIIIELEESRCSNVR